MTQLADARLSLEGLSLGDAFGDRFFLHAHTAKALIAERALPKPPWDFTDDTNMALSIYEILRLHGSIEQDALADSFAKHYEPSRGYGAAMHGVLRRIAAGESWRGVAASLFEGQGSYGNGAAMRTAPLGAYFADDLDRVVAEAHRAAEVTHAHPEGIAGAIAVSVAAAQAARLRGQPAPEPDAFLESVLPYIPESEVKSGIRRAREIRTKAVAPVIRMIGNGYNISAQDTVPFTLWCASQRLSNFEEAMWLTVSGLGDIDTNCAIVGGIVALFVGVENLPPTWIANREPLPDWALGEAQA
ncbi:MAG: ADP-ribosylglycohydrolase family protein [Chloroflexi bacterium]|nr:ADP-ribosylglycohydrolase family protein [Chloroflexota bacterium]